MPPPCFSVRMVLAWCWAVPGFFQTWHLAFTPNWFSVNFCLIWPEASAWQFYHTGLQRQWYFWKENSRVLKERTLGSWLPLWLKPFFPIAQFRWAARSRKSPGGSKLDPRGHHVCTMNDTFKQKKLFRTVPQICVSSNHVLRFLWLHAAFLLQNSLSTVEPYIDRSVHLSKSCPVNWIYSN